MKCHHYNNTRASHRKVLDCKSDSICVAAMYKVGKNHTHVWKNRDVALDQSFYQFCKTRVHCTIKTYYLIARLNWKQGSHFFPLTNFPDFSSVFFIFPWLLFNIFMALFNTSTCTKILFLQYWEVRIFTLLHPKILSWNSNNSTLNTLWACSWDGVVHTLPKKGNFRIVFVGKNPVIFWFLID